MWLSWYDLQEKKYRKNTLKKKEIRKNVGSIVCTMSGELSPQEADIFT